MKTPQQTSISAFHERRELIQSETSLVFEALRNCDGDLTDSEIAWITRLPKNYVWSRRSSLVNRGLVVSNGTRVCGQTSKTVLSWKVRKQ
jgi:hypothetical protein